MHVCNRIPMITIHIPMRLKAGLRPLTFNMIVGLHFNCQKDHHCHQLCQQRTSPEDEFKYWISAESEESTFVCSKVMRIVHLKAFLTPKIGWTGMATWIIEMTQKTIGWQMLNLIYSKAMVSMIRNSQSSGLWVPRQIFRDWFGQRGRRRDRLITCLWRLMQFKRWAIRGWRNSRTESVNVSPATLCSSTESFS